MAETQASGNLEAAIRKHRMAAVCLRCTLPDGKPLPAGSIVGVEQTRHAFLFGCLTNGWGLCRSPQLEQAFRTTCADLFNYATVLFHWGRSLSQTAPYEPEPGVTEADQRQALLVWCRQHSMIVRGHPLVFFFQPKWVSTCSREERERFLWRRVEREARTFAGAVDYWDTVNEPTTQGRYALRHGGRASEDVFRRYGPVGVMERTHALVREADARVRLIINDWDTGEALASVLDEAFEAGIEIDAIGFQEHCFETPPDFAAIAATCDRFSRFGVPLHFTEVMMPSCTDEGRAKLTYTREKNKASRTCTDGEVRQAQEVEAFYTNLFAHPAVEGITWWGLSDYLGCCDAPVGLLREDMTPKPAHTRLRQLIKERWWTKKKCRVEPGGFVAVHGFLGDYRVVLDEAGLPCTGTFTLSRDGRHVDVRLERIPVRRVDQ